MSSSRLLTLDNVQVHFPISRDWRGRPKTFAHALNGVSLQLQAGETLGIVGESGCGKSTLAQILAGLLRPTSGQLSGKLGSQAQLQMVFQDPQSSLNPRLPIWRIIAEPCYVAHRISATEQKRLAAEVAEKVGIRSEYLERYPHEFSGGQRQRIAIARALAAKPDILVLDEPTSALDISVQAQILNLLVKLQQEQGLSYILISHNVSVIQHMSDRVAVMYLGQVVESGPCEQVLSHPAHPYTQMLLDAVPKLGLALDEQVNEKTELPSNRQLPSGCFFADRCPQRSTGCEQLQILKPYQMLEHEVRCHQVGN